LFEIVQRLHRAADLSAMVVSGAGPFFSAGGDLKEFSATVDLEALVFDLATTLHRAMDLFARLDESPIGAVQGNTPAASVSPVAGFDLALVAHTATFTMG
jgi:2-(1,2-epoxy-1,2-dihydrophenyl)acetyl-CoA isomerase